MILDCLVSGACGLMEKGVPEPLNHPAGQAGLGPVSSALMSLSQATLRVHPEEDTSLRVMAVST